MTTLSYSATLTIDNAYVAIDAVVKTCPALAYAYNYANAHDCKAVDDRISHAICHYVNIGYTVRQFIPLISSFIRSAYHEVANAETQRVLDLIDFYH